MSVECSRGVDMSDKSEVPPLVADDSEMILDVGDTEEASAGAGADVVMVEDDEILEIGDDDDEELLDFEEEGAKESREQSMVDNDEISEEMGDEEKDSEGEGFYTVVEGYQEEEEEVDEGEVEVEEVEVEEEQNEPQEVDEEEVKEEDDEPQEKIEQEEQEESEDPEQPVELVELESEVASNVDNSNDNENNDTINDEKRFEQGGEQNDEPRNEPSQESAAVEEPIEVPSDDAAEEVVSVNSSDEDNDVAKSVNGIEQENNEEPNEELIEKNGPEPEIDASEQEPEIVESEQKEEIATEPLPTSASSKEFSDTSFRSSHPNPEKMTTATTAETAIPIILETASSRCFVVPPPAYLDQDDFSLPVLHKEDVGSIVEGNFDSIFHSIRQTEVLKDDISIGKELVLTVDELSLSISEDNYYANEVTLMDLVNLKIKDNLKRKKMAKEPLELDQLALTLKLTCKDRFITQFNLLCSEEVSDNEKAEDDHEDAKDDSEIGFVTAIMDNQVGEQISDEEDILDEIDEEDAEISTKHLLEDDEEVEQASVKKPKVE